jgi:ribosomal protein L11 methylase PrmA
MGRITEALEHRLLLALMGDPAGRRALDVGCGDGALTVALAIRGAGACGIDVDPGMLAAVWPLRS